MVGAAVARRHYFLLVSSRCIRAKLSLGAPATLLDQFGARSSHRMNER
jgi:hypothetical protein